MQASESMKELVEFARRARERAYAPYSGFDVGAAVRAPDGRVFAGCNVENASYGLSICAERVAIFNAVAAGVREVVEIAVFTEGAEPAPPCGACRQVMAEFAREAQVALANGDGKLVVTSLAQLLPNPFRLDRR